MTRDISVLLEQVRTFTYFTYLVHTIIVVMRWIKCRTGLRLHWVQSLVTQTTSMAEKCDEQFVISDLILVRIAP